jgi:hypothetical protein
MNRSVASSQHDPVTSLARKDPSTALGMTILYARQDNYRETDPNAARSHASFPFLLCIDRQSGQVPVFSPGEATHN